ncbi:MAG: hypothetical protein JO354_04045, partial [Verrucomicrobia bacterium]|nr:hypothetical protein [Verrucomicrobiota bacterium]
LLDFGFAPSVIRSAGYLWAGAQNLLPFGVETTPTEGEPQSEHEPNRKLLADLVTSVRAYYSGIALIVLFLLLTAGGTWIWIKTAPLANHNSLRAAFVVYATGVSLNFANAIWPYLLSAINGVRQSQQIFAFSLLSYYIIAAAGLLLGAKVWALVIGIFVMGVVERLLGRRAFLRLCVLPKGTFRINLLKTLWPNAWRGGAVSVGAFMVTQANTLICSAYLGLDTTASFGLTVQAVGLLIGVSSVWVTVKVPVINQLRTRNLFAEIAALFRPRIVLALLTYIVGATGLILFGPGLLALVRTRTELLPPSLLLCLCLIYFLQMHHSLYSELVYSENVNPFPKPSLLSGVATVALAIVSTPRFGLWGLLGSVGLVQLCFNNWWTVLRAVRGLGPAAKDYWRGFVPRST